MKITVSIPDEVFEAAEKIAKQLGVSRSELYSNAVKDYIKPHISEDITSTLNALYSREDSSVDPILQCMMVSSLEREDW